MAHISPQLIDILRCPVTGSTVTLDNEELVASAADARGNTPRYSLHEGIPVMLRPTSTAGTSQIREGN